MYVLQSRVLLRPTDFERSVRFYEHQLGLVRYREWGDAPHRGIVYFLGGGFLELAETRAGTQPAGVRLWLQVADAAIAREELAATGVTIAEEPGLRPWGLIELVIHDPDGLPIHVIETPITHPLRRRV